MASMCWSTVPTGVFDSTRAERILEELFATVNLYRIKYDDTELSKSRELVGRLGEVINNSIHFQEKAKNFISHYDDCNALTDEMPDDESCQCGMDMFAHDNHVSITIARAALKEIGEGK